MSPCRRIPLPGIAHFIMRKYFQVLEVHRGMKHIQDLSCKKGIDYVLFMYFVKFWIFIQFLLNFGQKTQFLFMYEEKSCN